MTYLRHTLSSAAILIMTATSFATAKPFIGASYTIQDLRGHELAFVNPQVHEANFSPLSHLSSRTSCAATEPPEALATPDPLLDAHASTTVSFIIGTDGRVHSPLILESLGPSGDRIVLDAVRTWRYRPATCNGVPTEVEGKIEISSR